MLGWRGTGKGEGGGVLVKCAVFHFFNQFAVIIRQE